jgi:uncharacterized protein (TIGR02996 family)
MDYADAFVRAVVEAPNDDAPRLAYADWLEERGDPCGEFIRVQVELARSVPLLPLVVCERRPRYSRHHPDGLARAEVTGHCQGALSRLPELVGAEVEVRFPGGALRGFVINRVEADGRVSGESVGPPVEVPPGARRVAPEVLAALRRREQELLGGSPAPIRWAPTGVPWAALRSCEDTGPYGPDTVAAFHRGFVELVALPCVVFLRHGPALAAATPLRKVWLSDRAPEWLDPPGSYWWAFRLPEEGLSAPHFLPAHFSRALRAPRPAGGRWGGWPAARGALDAAGDAALSWARSEAGLPA